ncbi:MAG: molybdenum cofactor guanylyltransferase [Proteobacteria bacterium]|nr:molybdenum cofactor guanylyltransferase [Pseudomonadota bacterium]
MQQHISLNTITGVILAGGESRRFGSNKALALYNGKPLLAHVAATMEKIFTNRLLVTNTPDLFRFINWPMTGDIYNGCGPLGGIHAALSKTAASQIFITGCDMPLINPEIIRFLCGLSGDWDVALPWLEKGPEPLYAVYRKTALPAFENALAAKQNKIVQVLEKVTVRKISMEEILAVSDGLSSFANINKPHELQALKPE